MSTKQKDIAELSLAERMEKSLNGFLARYKKVLIIVLAVIVIALVVVGIVSTVNKNKLHGQFDLIGSLETSYSELSALATDDATYQSKHDDLVGQLKTLAADGKKYPNLKAQYLLGMVSYNSKSYQEALDAFVSVYSNANGSYLGSLALTNAAVSAEELGNDSLALEYYTKVIDEFGLTSAEAPKALFGQARLQEKSGNNDLAKAVLQQLADQFPTSEFAKLATNRLALL